MNYNSRYKDKAPYNKLKVIKKSVINKDIYLIF
jgi:hypothetical protein